MIRFLERMLHPQIDPLVEGMYADQYPNEEGRSTRSLIRERYQSRWLEPTLAKTPLSHPWLFDPCEPPPGWRYDPYYEIWIQL